MKLIKRFGSFYKTLSSCDKPHVKYLKKMQENDFRSIFGRNTQNILKEAKYELMQDINFNNLIYEFVPLQDEWKILILCDLIEMRADRMEANLSKEEIREMIVAVST